MALEEYRAAQRSAPGYRARIGPRLVAISLEGVFPLTGGGGGGQVTARGLKKRKDEWLLESTWASAGETIAQDAKDATKRLMAGRLVSLLFFVLLVYLARLLQRNREALKAAS
jgi:hypothetical protein